MLRDDWELRGSFRENLEGKLFASATTVVIITLHGFTFFYILSTIIYSTCAVPISTSGGTRPIPTISQGDGENLND